MRTHRFGRIAGLSLVSALLLAAPPTGRAGSPKPTADAIPVEYYRLPNGLRVVLSPDNSAPIAVVAVYYHIGFRNEPKGRTGFAHLFEHMMFQGSRNLGKMEFIRLMQKNGGVLNGSTRFDFTNYYEILPSHKLETMLWAEADRMKTLSVTQDNLTNQQGVVENEVKVNVLNQPYGGFPWLDMPQVANTNWNNAHNFYGDLNDLEAAKLDDVEKFHATYYAPNNAVLTVVGDFKPADAKALVGKYFGAIPSSTLPAPPDLTEPPQTAPKSQTKVDSLANEPAIAFAYHMPARGTPEFYAMGLLDQILVQGTDSRLSDALVHRSGIAQSVDGGINLLGNMFDYEGPMLWMFSCIHDAATTPDAITSIVDSVVATVRDKPPDEETMERARVKFRSAYYDMTSDFYGFGKADLLASFALFDDDPGKINNVEKELQQVTPQLIQKTAQEFLQKNGQTRLMIAAAGGKK